MWSNKPVTQYSLVSSESPHIVSNFAASFGSVLGAQMPWSNVSKNKPIPVATAIVEGVQSLSWDDVGTVSKLKQHEKKQSTSLKQQTIPTVIVPDTEPQQQDTEVLDDVNKLLHEDDIMFQLDDIKPDPSTLSSAMNEIDEGSFPFVPFEHNYQHSLQQEDFKTPTKPTSQQPILICKFFADFGICKAGKNCRFSHDEQLLQSTSVTFSEPYPKTPSPPILPTQTVTPQASYNPTIIQPLVDTTTPSSPMAIANNNKAAINNKYCRFFLQGFCRNADTCPFIHANPSPPSYTTPLPVIYSNSPTLPSPVDVTSPRSIPNASTNKPQRSPSFNGSNSLGTIVSNSADTSNKICPFYLKGECKFGDRCRYLHPKQALLRKNSLHKERQLLSEESLRKFSQIPCKYFTQQGSCPFGDQCFYKHDTQYDEDMDFADEYDDTQNM